jgi:hypothetical protein
MPDDLYHGDTRTLSASDAKALLDCPARFHYQRHFGGRPDKKVYDKGTAAHTLVLATGRTMCIINEPDWRKQSTRDMRTSARLASPPKTPMLRHELRDAAGIRRAVRRHREAGVLFADGEAELSLYWPDPDTGLNLRARLDWVTRLRSGRPCIVDLKTTGEGGAHPRAFAKTAENLKYDMAAAHYLAGAVATNLVDPEAAFLHVVVETTPPYPVQVYQLDDADLLAGGALMRDAINLYQRCTQTGRWPAYVDGVTVISLPGYRK